MGYRRTILTSTMYQRGSSGVDLGSCFLLLESSAVLSGYASLATSQIPTMPG